MSTTASQEENNIEEKSLAVANDESEEIDSTSSMDPSTSVVRTKILWKSVVRLTVLHIGAVYGLYLILSSAKWATWAWGIFYYLFGGHGITGGAHRLWSHRSFKAKWPLRLLAAAAETAAGQISIYEWARDHRVHHKFSETNADPHNAKRGFFFAHMGWLMCKKHPEVIRCGKMIDCSDLLADPIVYYQHKYFLPLYLIFNFTVPTFVPWYFWGESLSTSFFGAAVLRNVFLLHVTWLVNSAAHLLGSHPYDKNINPAQNMLVAMLAAGEGWHNYHHVFPWDYKTAELGPYTLNFTSLTIDFFAWIGLAYDRRSVSEEVVRNRVYRTGDGSHPEFPIKEE